MRDRLAAGIATPPLPDPILPQLLTLAPCPVLPWLLALLALPHPYPCPLPPSLLRQQQTNAHSHAIYVCKYIYILFIYIHIYIHIYGGTSTVNRVSSLAELTEHRDTRQNTNYLPEAAGAEANQREIYA